MFHDDINPMVDFDMYPSKTIETLVALEDLGRDFTEKAWLCVPDSRSHSATCVLKFDNEYVKSSKLLRESEMWHLIYTELSHVIKLEHWSKYSTCDSTSCKSL